MADEIVVGTYLWLGGHTLHKSALACGFVCICRWWRGCESQRNHGKKDIKELHRGGR